MSEEQIKTPVETSTVSVEKAVIRQIQSMLGEMSRGLVPFDDEMSAAQQALEGLMTDSGPGYLMQGLYRCPSCHWQWKTTDELCAAMDCLECGASDVEPFYSGDAGDDDLVTVRAQAEHEKRFPAPSEFGTYTVEVHRTALRIAEFEIEGAAGPASARMAAMIKAPDEGFSSDLTVEYSVEGCSLEQGFAIGQRFQWTDPDSDDPASDCSCEVTIAGFKGDFVIAKTDKGSEVEAHYSELTLNA